MKSGHEISRLEALSNAVLVGLLSVALDWSCVGLRFGLPGFIYSLVGPLCWWNGEVGGRRKRELESRRSSAA